MHRNSSEFSISRPAGFTLPAVLIVVSALLILVIGLLAMSGVERRTARSYVELQQADMAARAGLEHVKGILNRESANDDFLVVANTPPLPQDVNKTLEAPPYLYLARGEMEGDKVKYSYHPLFSTATGFKGSATGKLLAPEAEGQFGGEPAKMEVLPWMNPAYGAWVPVTGKKNGKERTVARYAFWVEDLEGKINPKVAGNEKNGVHTRSEYPFPAPGLKDPEEFPDKKDADLNGIAIHALDEKSSDTPKGSLTKKVLDGRDLMISPDSILGATGFAPPLTRGDDGLLADPLAAALEINTSPVIQSYEERPMIPFSLGISKESAGKPKLNLNKLLDGPRSAAVDNFASHVTRALPDFEVRRTGNTPGQPRKYFPEDYIKTLAANALDYADADSDPTLQPGVYRGLDAYPLMSEILLKVDYQGKTVKNNRLHLLFEFKLFAEFWNMTNLPVEGNARLSYEVALDLRPSFGSAAGSVPFDRPSLLADKNKVSHNLEMVDGGYFSKPVPVSLQPDEYRFYEFAKVNYSMDVGPNNISYASKFGLIETMGARGLTFKWNDQPVERIHSINRDPFSFDDFTILYPEMTAKAAIPSHSYGPYGDFVNNIGDPRMSHYFRNPLYPLGENAYPGNLSPNRRNIRRATIYDKPGGTANFYGRVMPSEWPDRGHDSAYGFLPAISDKAMTPTTKTYEYKSKRLPENAPQRLSNAGRYYSATELGRVYDPLMFDFIYDDIKGKGGSGSADTAILAKGVMPPMRNVFPDVSMAPPSNKQGGGNTLRIGRYEHKKFDLEGYRAAYFLDLFHTGKSLSEDEGDREGDLVEINGRINLNTASKDAIRAMAAGMLKQDPELRKVTQWSHDISNGNLFPKTTKLELGTPTRESAADIVADAIVLRRPYSAMGELAAIRDKNEDPVFGNPDLYTDHKNIQWTDAAAEELFSRIHDAGTFRSRNFRVWVIGQSLAGSEENPEILAETRKVFTVFADPGERRSDGEIDPGKFKSRVIYENNF